ncbi:hypothetical protein MH117_05195 [Paenibacillus sp. ACRRX]|uniref:hypothetical protein n=1 Tax=Paenibacillus sp. ACRRX TaxID=2918206 RepID=UPI001EF61E02|nr:hypothetical protein [Paenibacillus sp. ACRRX]
MSSALFIVIGTIEVFAVLTTALRIFRFKVSWYLRDILIMSVVLALSSYLIRIVLAIPYLDMPIAILAVIVFMRFAIKVKPHYAVILSLSGYASYISVQSIVYFLLSLILDFDSALLTQQQGTYLYLLQLTTAGTTMLLSFLLYKLGLGFTFIIHPPHSFNIKINKKKEGKVFYATVATFLILSGALGFLLSGYGWVAYIIVALNFIALYILLHRRSEQE